MDPNSVTGNVRVPLLRQACPCRTVSEEGQGWGRGLGGSGASSRAEEGGRRGTVHTVRVPFQVLSPEGWNQFKSG